MSKPITKTLYVAHCIEHGDKFVSLFQTNETDKEKLLDFGHDLAIDWGGECYKVTKWKPKVTKMVRLTDSRKPMQMPIETTVRRWETWKRKHPGAVGYYHVEHFEDREPKPETAWDCDLSTDENLAEVK